MEIFVDGKVLVMDNYKKLKVAGIKFKNMKLMAQQKGLKEELKEFGNAIKKSAEWPIPLWQQLQATEIALQVEKLILERS